MIISFSKKFVFVHIHKCAGSSIEMHCGSFLKPYDILLGPGRSRLQQIPSAAVKRITGLRKHSPAMDIQRVIGHERYSRFLSFAVIRHPEDRVVSLYRYLMRLAQRLYAFPKDIPPDKVLEAFWEAHGMTFERAQTLSLNERRPYLRPVTKIGKTHEWAAMDALMTSRRLEDFLVHPSNARNPALQSQFSRLKDPTSDGLIVNSVLRQERLADDWPAIATQISVPPQLPLHNSSHRMQKPTVSAQTRAAIEARFKDDFEAFDFELRSS